MPVTSTSASILVDVEGPVCQVVMNRPESLNALNLELMDTMASVMRDISNDDSIRCVVLSGAGDHFMAGGDIKHFGARLGAVSDRTAFRHEIEAMINGFHETVFHMRAMPKPIIASVRGAVAGTLHAGTWHSQSASPARQPGTRPGLPAWSTSRGASGKGVLNARSSGTLP